jgi:hypothetical protein
MSMVEGPVQPPASGPASDSNRWSFIAFSLGVAAFISQPMFILGADRAGRVAVLILVIVLLAGWIASIVMMLKGARTAMWWATITFAPFLLLSTFIFVRWVLAYLPCMYMEC